MLLPGMAIMGKQPLPSTRDFQFVGGALAIDFVNTVGNRLGDKRDYLSSPKELKRWAQLAGLLHAGEKLSLSAIQQKHILSAREELYRIFRAAADKKLMPASGIEKLNRRLAALAPHRQVLRRGKVFHWAWKTSQHDPARLLAPILFDAAELLTSGRVRKIRQCEGQTCGWLFLDRSQAGKRRWCSMSDCGNCDKVRRYYRRSHGSRSPVRS